MTAAKKTADYGDSQIKVLKGIEPILRRPGMYTDTESPNHMIGEVIDNAQDEALAGEASKISVELFEDGSVAVEDNGRGIPTGMNKAEGKSTVEVIFTTTHAGGKFGEAGNRGAYGMTGGLHGVGVTVTNALSKRLEVTIWRDGYEHQITFENGAVSSPLKKKKAEDPARRGTRVHAWPDLKHFDGPLQVARFERMLHAKAVLMPGVEVVWKRPDRDVVSWKFVDGIGEFLTEELGEESLVVAPLFQANKFYEGEEGNFHEGEGFDLALGFQEQGHAVRQSYVNLIPTKDGGQHESGLRSGMYQAIKGVLDHLGIVPSKVKVEPEDVWAKSSFILSVKLLDPAFQNQTKDKMTDKRGKELVEKLVRDNLELWLHDHPDHARAIGELVVSEAQRRQKAHVNVERRSSTSAAVLPGKLTDCESNDPTICELFLVEGDSAGGSVRQGRDRTRQALLPLRGKVINTWELDTADLITHAEPRDIGAAIGVAPHMGKPVDQVDLSKLRYHKIFILADADIDGFHIQVLLMTLFLKHFPAVIEGGHLWIAQPPLFRIDAPAKKGSKEKFEKIYVLNEPEREKALRDLEKRGVKEHQITIQRFKGLGEMNPIQLRETTLDPSARATLQLTVADAKATLEAFELMMVKKNSDSRRIWMERDGSHVEADI